MTNSFCKQCQVETVEVSDQTLQKIRAEMRPNFKSLAAKPVNGWWSICPVCDGYALGMELERGFAIRTASGELTEIHELADNLGFPGL